MRFDVVTLFPELVNSLTASGVVGRAAGQDLINLTCWNPRDYTHDRHQTVDDRSYGGGPGMVMKVQPLRDTVHDIKQQTAMNAASRRVIYLSPQGKQFNQAAAQELAKCSQLIFIAGRYEGVDERFIETEVDEEWSLGDYVLSGGELPAMVMIDSIARMIPGVLGDQESAEQDSFMNRLLDHPHYTRPELLDDLKVPAVLTGGDHKKIEQWRRQQALGRTWLRRPDLLKELELGEVDQVLLDQFIAEHNGKR
ncbi:MAG: tRNA (guanosine(37)-N1)-methyltransferase TrmD [Gammaproteobacteria bacterium]|nr:tRNA (guanosine(37)-N1)-methyltransferase TrmD [Gammaproteobacteria bacterium]